MASASDRSILNGVVDLNDTAQIRKIMRGLQYHLTHSILSPSSEHLRDLSQDENSLLCTIMAAIRLHAQKYPLLLEASLRFVSEQYRDDKGVQSAAVQFMTLADGPVYTAPNLHIEAYEEAEASMEYIRGPYDVLRIRQRAAELAPGAFGRQIYSTSRAAQIEAIASKGSGDVRDIPEGVQFRPRPAQDAPNTLNSGRCEQCIGSNSTCDRKEPHCTECRFTWRECFYKSPSSGIVEEPVAAATHEPASPVATVSEAPEPALANTRATNPSASKAATAKPDATNAAAAKPAATKPAASKAATTKPAATKVLAPKATALKPAAVKGGPATKGGSATRATASKVTAEKATEEKPAATKPIETKPAAKAAAPKPAAKPTVTKPIKKAVAPKAAAPKASTAKPASSRPLPPPSDRVTRSIARSTVPVPSGSNAEPIPSVQLANNKDGINTEVPATHQTEGRKRKQQALGDGDESASSRPSKMAKSDVAVEPQPEARKRKQPAEDDDDEPFSPQPSKKVKTDDAAESEPDENGATGARNPSSATRNNGEAARRPARGRPEQNHAGKKCCNTCQAWKNLSEFGLKRHSKVAGALVGYCLRCQASKQAKNKAKADAKKKSIESAEIDDNAEGESSGDDHDQNENGTLGGAAVETRG